MTEHPTGQMQEPAVLLDIYTPQIAEYVNAVRKFAGPAAGITALLYSTASGATLEVKTD